MHLNSKPLVSVVVISYNSATFIIDTLESIYAQSYPNIELIVSDDSSNDESVSLCEQWLISREPRFICTQIVTHFINTGVTANLKRGEQYAKGVYIKSIAADDLLTEDAIAQYVAYMEEYPETTYLFGKMHAFGDNKEEAAAFERNMLQYQFFQLSAKEQYQCLMNNGCYIPAPSFFYNREKNTQLGISLDEEIPMVEDWPRWINITRKDVKLHLLDSITVHYRLHSKAISKSKGISAFAKSQMLMFIKYQFRYNLLRHPRTTWIKYVMYKQVLTNNKIWFAIERIGRFFDGIYRKLRSSDINDWEKMAETLSSK